MPFNPTFNVMPNDDFLDNHPEAGSHFKYLSAVEAKQRATNLGLNNQLRDLQERLANSQSRELRVKEGWAKKHYQMPEKDQSRFVKEQAVTRADIAATNAGLKKIKFLNLEPTVKFINKFRFKRYREKTIYPIESNGREAKTIIATYTEGVEDFLAQIAGVERMPCTDDETANFIRANVAQIKKLGAMEFRNVTSGGADDADGNFILNVPRLLQFSTTSPLVAVDLPDKSKASGFATMPDALAFIFDILDEDDAVTNALIKKALASVAGQPKMSMPDKRAKLTDLNSQLIEAERWLEASIRFAEAQGLEVNRKFVRPQVLLWLDSTPILKVVAPPKPAKDVDEMTAADFDGDADEMSPEEIAKNIAVIQATLPTKVA